jgi:hypothetical protein
VSYFARIDRWGIIGYHHAAGSLTVYELSADPVPVGIAHCTNWGDNVPSLWELTVHGRKLEGLWLLVSGAFTPAQQSGQAPGAG